MSEQNEQYPQGNSIAQMGWARAAVNWAGALVSIALIIGLISWMFDLGTRDPNEIPIIRAMEGPSRTTPEDAGGSQAAHQGLAVNAVQSEGGIEKPAQSVSLAPKPRPLEREDVPQQQLAEAKPVLREQAPQQTPQTAPNAEISTEQEIINQVTNNKKPAADSTQDPSLIVEELILQKNVQVIAASKFAPLQSSIPRPRPADLNKRIEQAVLLATKSNEPAASSQIAVGTRLVQLGAYDNPEIAKKEWDSLMSKHGDLLEGKQRLIQSAESGGRKFYRLRAVGFENATESRNMCSAMLARGTPCIPVTAR